MRQNFIAFTVSQSGSAPILNALSDVFKNVAKHDYPGLWPSIDAEVREGLASGDVPRTLVTLRLMHALARFYSMRHFCEAMDGLSPMAGLFQATMGVLLPLARFLLAGQDSAAAAEGLALCLKVYYRGVEYRFCDYPAVCDKDTSAAWLALCLDVLRKELPPPPATGAAAPGAFASPADANDRAEWAPWKAKKWAGRVLLRMARKWTPGELEREGDEEAAAEAAYAVAGAGAVARSGEAIQRASEARARARALPAARAFKASVAPAAVGLVLQQLLAWSASASGAGEGAAWLSPALRCIYMGLIEEASAFKSVWVPLRPHMPQLIQVILPAALRPTAADLEDLEEDPESWLLEQGDVMAMHADPRHAAECLLRQLLETRKKTCMPLLVGLLQSALGAYAAAAPGARDALHKDAVLRMLCAAAEYVRRSKAVVGMLQALLVVHVSPDLAPGAPTILRVRALQTWATFVGSKMIAKEAKVGVCSALVACMGDSVLAVRQTACIALAPFLASSKACRVALRPHIVHIVRQLFTLLNEMGLDGVVTTVQVIADNYHAELLELAGPIAQAIGALASRLMRAAIDGDEDNQAASEEAAMAAEGCCQIIKIVVDKLQAPPGPGPHASPLWAEGAAVLRRDVVPHVWQLLESMLDVEKGDGNEFLDEALAITFSLYDALELELCQCPAAWSMFVRIQRYIARHAADDVSAWSSVCDAAIAAAGPFGRFHGPDPATGLDAADELIQCIEAVEQSHSEDACETAARVVLSLLHYCRGGLDRVLQRIVAIYSAGMLEGKTESYLRVASSVLAMCLQYNAGAAVGYMLTLPAGVLPAGAGPADVFAKWMATMTSLATRSAAPPSPPRRSRALCCTRRCARWGCAACFATRARARSLRACCRCPPSWASPRACWAASRRAAPRPRPSRPRPRGAAPRAPRPTPTRPRTSPRLTTTRRTRATATSTATRRRRARARAPRARRSRAASPTARSSGPTRRRSLTLTGRCRRSTTAARRSFSTPPWRRSRPRPCGRRSRPPSTPRRSKSFGPPRRAAASSPRRA